MKIVQDGESYMPRCSKQCDPNDVIMSVFCPQPIPEEQPEERKEQERKPSQAEILIRLVEESGTTFFHTDAGDPYAVILNGRHSEVWQLDGKSFKFWLNGLYYKETSRPVNNDAVGQAVATLSAKALFDHPKPVTLHTRVAQQDHDFWYDLANEDWAAVKITPRAWTIENPPILFNRYSHQSAQTTPIVGGDITKILKYIPIKEQSFLFLCWLVSAFIPNIPHPMPIFYGEKGAAKSTSCEFLKSLIDPSALKTMTLSSDQRTLAVNLQQHWFLPFDNISFIRPVH